MEIDITFPGGKKINAGMSGMVTLPLGIDGGVGFSGKLAVAGIMGMLP